MKRLNDGTWVEFETKVGEFEFSDANGTHAVSVVTDGEFWRVASVSLPNAGLVPSAARGLGRLLLRAAALAEKEEKRIAAQDEKEEKRLKAQAEKKQLKA